ncbi:MAG: RNA-binding protein [Bacteroidia bacterium]|nr:RNA-binding protein [Bacteroidia bacterium]
MNIYVGNLSYKTSENDLSQLFGTYGEVTSAKIVMDKMTNRSKGFGFVEMSNDEHAKTAIEEINGKDVGGRNLKVNESIPKDSNR